MVAEAPLVDIMAVEVLPGDFMEVDLVEEEVREVTAKPHRYSLLIMLIIIRDFFGFGKFGLPHLNFQEETGEADPKGWPGNRIKKWEIERISHCDFFLPLAEKRL